MILFFAKHVLVATRGNINYQKRYVHGAQSAATRLELRRYQPHPERHASKIKALATQAAVEKHEEGSSQSYSL